MMDINCYIGSKIKEYRTKNNISQEELAEYLKTTPQAISRYELGQRKTNNDILFELADYFKISINDFFPDTTNGDSKNYKQILKDKGLMDENDNIDEKSLNKLLEIADMIKGYKKED